MTAILDHHGQEMKSTRSERHEALRGQIQESFRAKYQALKAKFDAAQTNTDNERHWALADDLSAEAAANPGVRRTLRNRSRYECQESNAYGKGIILKHANHLIGRCPRLQMQLDDKPLNRFIEKFFLGWSIAVQLGRKFRTMAKSKTVDGESFAKMFTNEKLSHGVKLDLRLVEADQIATPFLTGLDPNYIDGIKFDSTGVNVEHYDMLKSHPGAMVVAPSVSPLDVTEVPAEEMLHWFREDRPNQKRGLPETTASLPLFAQLRRFTMATIAAAETAAEYAGVIKTLTTPDGGAAEIDPMEIINIEMRSLLTLPEGWDINQIKAEHPATTFEMFERAIVTQMAQPMQMPYNVAAGDSSRHNFASGKLDYKHYDGAIRVERYDFVCGPLRQLFAAWYREFRMWVKERRLWPTDLPAFDELTFTWFFDQVDYSVDRNKEASGTATLFSIGASNPVMHFGEMGEDWEAAAEAGAAAYNVSVDEYLELVRNATFAAGIKAGEPAPDQKSIKAALAAGAEACGVTVDEFLELASSGEIQATRKAA